MSSQQIHRNLIDAQDNEDVDAAYLRLWAAQNEIVEAEATRQERIKWLRVVLVGIVTLALWLIVRALP